MTPTLQPAVLTYAWLRNDRPLATSSNSYLHAFANGTLRLSNAKISTGEFRCVATDRAFRSGAIISTASHVQQAGK